MLWVVGVQEVEAKLVRSFQGWDEPLGVGGEVVVGSLAHYVSLAADNDLSSTSPAAREKRGMFYSLHRVKV